MAQPGTILTPLLARLLPLLEREGLKVVHLIKEDSSVVFKNVFFEPTLENLSSSLSGADLVLTENFGADAPNKIEILRKYWSETPLSDEKDLIAVFPRNGINRPGRNGRIFSKILCVRFHKRNGLIIQRIVYVE